MHLQSFPVFAVLALAATTALAELKLPAVISDHMVLQQKQADPIWGWDAPGTKITVEFAGQIKTSIADADGKWIVKLDPLPANDTPQVLTIKGTETRQIDDVLIGEVWICSGQSNMRFNLARDWNGDLEAAASTFPNMRLMRVGFRGSQKPLIHGDGKWKSATPETAASFSAVGFHYGRFLHKILKVPVGLIDNAWVGSQVEAWVPRESLEKDSRFTSLMERTREKEAFLASDQALADYESKLEAWRAEVARAESTQKPIPPRPESPDEWLRGNARPGNLYGGTLFQTIGYGIKGVIWYQGESNTGPGRAKEYAEIFPFLIERWREEWGQAEFPFYWVQLPGFSTDTNEPGDNHWAELREAQTRTMKIPNTGQAVTIDLGESKDIHPRNKYPVAARLVRWSLVKDYGLQFPYRSPEFQSFETKGNKAVVRFNCFGSSLRTFGVNDALGFAVCGEDRIWHWTKGRIQGSAQVEVWSDQVAKPVAVRYAWAGNPVCNLFSSDGLPVTPFRTDDFEFRLLQPLPVLLRGEE
jgi:sialate O-acetylesterase